MPQKPLAEYEVDIPRVSARLVDQPEIQVFFDGLTPGYQREWARYVYGAVAETTQQKHFDEMCQILAAGYKSKRGYSQAKKK
ncbi:YdeI/OmpD-associated family protein [Latilactobacillus fuchuensis]|uniref:YdeI/OmpD-associated family protein n=1 Tax=Latilactobacillus fuchuensis TaxID=164393 RepID=UPI0020C7CBD0|nr:YdeI/OmpD-associated family protein [Latilactobacillus fuchuensis]MCP8857446.1 YdeI/OmpD-associated family protein [Latilactobacillus fuchuensis]